MTFQISLCSLQELNLLALFYSVPSSYEPLIDLLGFSGIACLQVAVMKIPIGIRQVGGRRVGAIVKKGLEIGSVLIEIGCLILSRSGLSSTD